MCLPNIPTFIAFLVPCGLLLSPSIGAPDLPPADLGDPDPELVALGEIEFEEPEADPDDDGAGEVAVDMFVAAAEVVGGAEAAVALPEVVVDEDALVEVVGGVEVAVAPKVVLEDGEEKKGDDDGEDSKGDGEEAEESASPTEAILKDLDYDPAAKDFAEKVDALFLTAEKLQAVREQIEDLDAEDFRARNDASKKLAMVEAPVEHLLGAARAEAGAEMARRIQSILNVRVKQRRLDALYHIANRIAIEGTPGFVERLLVMAETFDVSVHWDLLRMFELAVAKTAGEQDLELLKKALESESASSSEIAAFALGYRAGSSDKAPASGSPDLQEAGDRIKLASARGHAASETGGRAAATELLVLLGSDDIRVRHEAGLLLRLLFGKDLGFAAYDSDASRGEAVARWSNLISGGAAPGDGQPVVLGVGARGIFDVLVGMKPAKEGSVLSFSTSGKKRGPHELAAAMGGINPNRITFDAATGLIVASGGGDEDGRVAVFSKDGQELWNVSGIPAGGGAASLPGGRMLVAIGDEVEELDVTGDRIGLWKLDSKAAAFRALREGRFMCVHPEAGSVAEYNEAGEKIWSADGFKLPTLAERLPNGNLLVVASISKESRDENNSNTNAEDRLVELIESTPDGGTVIRRVQPKGVATITSAARLPNGNTLIGTEKGLAEYSPEGYAVKVWQKTPISSLHVR